MPHISANAVVMPVMKSTSACDTLMSASRGHGENQSMVEQLISDGNLRQRVRNWSPTGLMHMTM